MHEERQPPTSRETQSVNSLKVNQHHRQSSTTMIVPVWVSTQENPEHEVLTYALLDTQSDTTFLLEDTAAALNAETEHATLSLSTMSSQKSLIDSKKIRRLRVRGFKSTETLEIDQAFTREFIPADRTQIPTRKTVSDWQHLKPLLNKIPPLQTCDVGLLIGFNCPQALLPRETLVGGNSEPYAVQTILGWSIVGCSSRDNLASVCHRVTTKEVFPCMPRDVINALEKDFVHDKTEVEMSQEDLQFLRVQETNIQQLDNGHIQMPLPFRRRPALPDNKSQALQRLDHLRRKFERDPSYRESYTSMVQGIIDRGEAEEAPDDTIKGEVWYLPHHGVYHPQKGKLRVVFDCSATYKQTSLNQHLLSGPDLTSSLLGVLIRFREHPVAVACDIEKMFHQFLVQDNDRNYLRFLWWKNGDITKEPTVFRMKVHLFGATSSPGCANFGLKYLAKSYENEYPLAAEFIKHHFYVDDGLTSSDDADTAIQIIDQARKLCASGGIRLHKFLSNSREVLETVPESERATEVNGVDLNKDRLPVSTALGLQWNVEDDVFQYRAFTSEVKAKTRRGVLSTVASVYDPQGFLSPFILIGKQILQQMCKENSAWDEELSNDLMPQWEKWSEELKDIQNIKVARCFIPKNFGTVTRRELHHFSDASLSGYGQCSYIRLVNEKNEVHCSLVMSKARVTPLKVITLPRLELNAAVVSLKMSKVLESEMTEKYRHYFWTDSRIVLGYINNDTRRFKIYVANRVELIKEATSPQQWHYVRSEDNPADHASRGLSVEKLRDSTWFTGPRFLWNPDLEMADMPHNDVQLPEMDPEIKMSSVRSTQTVEKKSMIERLEKFSDWSRAVRAIARLKRRARGIKNASLTSEEERQETTTFLIKLAQEQKFEEKPPSSTLNPFKDNKGVIRVGGRLGQSSFAFSVQHPVILPKDSYVSKLIVSHFHKRIGHMGRGMTLNEVRANGFWILAGGKLTSEIIHRCVTCRKMRKPVEEQKMADLPSDRVEASCPFEYSAMDCFGPFIVKQNRKEFKRYGLLFTCLCSRAVHVEMLDDMSSDAFINALRCFISIRGKVRQIRSDQGSNFVGAKNEFTAALKEMDAQKVACYLANQDCDFLMNAPHSSHVGGVWERQIRTIRNVLAGVINLCPGRLDDSSLRTLFYEAMAIVNSRPLSIANINDPECAEPLTPNHILTMKSSVPLPPPGNFVSQDMYLRKRWRRVQFLTQQFWSRWRKEYLQNLNKRQCWTRCKRNITVGDIVLVVEPNVARNSWPLGRVVECIPSKDKLVRKAKICVGTDDLNSLGKRETKPVILERPIQNSQSSR
ncbi:uncharacterized protein LOC106175106 [Lingula anatina]|uniref:Uncharacterized protein LOC106175106 n=1 Tax=Lingula anatina TaxID=7574 RepID=A0A1S3JQZ5_LINAN|nr:uncharacterized protein LOC106175106 [Lingula anatina]|eukprot:XP_013412394.1 uncharacterized protein LOC106175106 [Lingula anatina]